MKLNEKKTKAMVINMSKKYQFVTDLELNGEQVEFVDSARLLGVHVSNDLTWNLNTKHIVKNGNLRLKLLHSAAKFTSNMKDLKIIYNQYVRSKLEYGCKVWHSGLTKQNRNDIERIQKSSCKIILGKNYTTYKKALKDLRMESLHDRRERLNLNFAKQSLKIPVMKKLFPLKISKHKMKKRKEQKYQVIKARTNRMKKSPVIYMQNLLNCDEERKMNDTKVILNSVNGDLCANGTLSSSFSLK